MLQPNTWQLFAITISFLGIAWPANMLTHGSKPVTVAQESEAEQDTPKKIDQTGIRWVFPFSAALTPLKRTRFLPCPFSFAFGETRHLGVHLLGF